jgi:DNA-directed RNA polymerase subunit K/omega
MSLTRTQYASIIKQVGGYYNFVTLVNRRLKEIRNGAPPMVQPSKGEDQIEMIVREIEAGHLHLTENATEAVVAEETEL